MHIHEALVNDVTLLHGRDGTRMILEFDFASLYEQCIDGSPASECTYIGMRRHKTKLGATEVDNAYQRPLVRKTKSQHPEPAETRSLCLLSSINPARFSVDTT